MDGFPTYIRAIFQPPVKEEIADCFNVVQWSPIYICTGGWANFCHKSALGNNKTVWLVTLVLASALEGVCL
jgi:hypothetical protein